MTIICYIKVWILFLKPVFTFISLLVFSVKHEKKEGRKKGKKRKMEDIRSKKRIKE